jgi:hypothetical protein
MIICLFCHKETYPTDNTNYYHFSCPHCTNHNVAVKFLCHQPMGAKIHSIYFYIGKQLPQPPFYRLRLDFYHQETSIHLKKFTNSNVMEEILLLPYVIKNVTPDNCSQKLKTLMVFS